MTPTIASAGRTLLFMSAAFFVAPLPARAATVPSGVHPDWTKFDLRPGGFQPQVAGLGFLSDGRLVVAHWDSTRDRGAGLETPRAFNGKVYVLGGVTGNTPNVTIDTIVQGLEDPMGLVVVNDTIYVSGGNTIVRLVRAGGNAGPVTRVDTVFILPGTPQTGSDSLRPQHGRQEYLNGLLHHNGKFYVSPSSLDPSAAGTAQINPHRGTYLEVTPGNGTTDKRGSFRIMATGLRAAAGLGFGPEGRHCVPDNQGEWLPSNKLICLQEGKFYGARKSGGTAAAYYAPWDNLTETPPTVWVVQNDIGNSPTAPYFMSWGPYAGQMLMGDVRWGTGINRYFLEKNSLGDLQGAAFVFTGGLEAGVFRMISGPDNMLYIGMIGGRNDGDGFPKNQTTATRVDFGLQKLRYNGDTTFEMRAVRSRTTGFEIEFSRPVDTTIAKLAASYTVQSYHMAPGSGYGVGNKQGTTTLVPQSILIAPDRRKVFLSLTGLVPSTPTQQRVVYIRLNNFRSSANDTLWATETWYTLNAFGTGNPFDPPVPLAPPVSLDPAASLSPSPGLRARVRGGNLVLQAPFPGGYEIRLRDLRGNLLAKTRGHGTGEHVLSLSAIPAAFVVVEARAIGNQNGKRFSRLLALP